MAQTKVDRLAALGMAPELAKEVNSQINSGAFTPAASQADSTATDVAGLVTDFNALLAKLRAAGIIAT